MQYSVTSAVVYDSFSIIIKRATLDRLTDPNNGIKYLTLHTPIVNLTFDLAALQEIQKQSTGDITLTVARETGLTGDMLAAVGTRPAYRLTVGYTGQDGKAAFVTSFGAGRVTVRLAYKLQQTSRPAACSLCTARMEKTRNGCTNPAMT